MSFSSDIKTALCEIEAEADCCATAQLYGMLFFARKFSNTGIEMTVTNSCIADTAAWLCKRQVGITPMVYKKDGGGAALRIYGKKNLSAVLDVFGHGMNEVSFSLNYGNIDNECCMQSFLRGAFLSCGRITDPQKGYHLEFTVSRIKAANALETMLQNAGYPPLTGFRNNSCVFYFKDSEVIEELLTAIGAVNGALEVMNTKVYKDLRNRVNRLTNCEAANIGKTVQASRAQLEAIKYIRSQGSGLRALPEELRSIALLREHNPDASLAEIGKMCEPPISRSGVNHRLARIMEAAQKLRETNSKEQN